MIRALVSLVAVALVLCGCAEGNSIYHNRALLNGASSTLSDARIVTLDAKQRNVFVVRLPATTATKTASAAGFSANMAICAEAAPDVFSALSASASGELNGSGLLSGATDKTLQLRAALAISEAAGSIERTQTINLLRESLYRTCERYMSGAIGRDEFIVQSARDQRNMVAILAIEQLTRSASPRATLLTAGGASSSVVGGADFFTELRKATDEASGAAEAQKIAVANYDAAKCDPILAATAPTDATALATYNTCDAAKKAVTAANDKVAKANSYLAAMKSLGPNASAPNAGATAGSGAAATIGANNPDPAVTDKIAAAVTDIVRMSYDFDEGEMLCIAKFRGDVPQIDPVLRDNCLALLTAKIQAKTQTYRAELQKAGAALVEPAAVKLRSTVNEGMICWAKSPAAFAQAAATVGNIEKQDAQAFAAADAQTVYNALTFLPAETTAAIILKACPPN
ncbi:hypothetical protein FPZ24_01920 [Sphingomonas panacisoli]|uniref:Uncharacterized protein n=1 Tax=Sphingomonas panacisoli TaxID=1813879 RepID=A0A5B8LE81_9SPHN|nr:hypothetical protein [Sphingomonas panacisoli]QDZ06381.1 hypothetical protein FPZ24_01920 [Sphingomonas panacisoli]